MNLELIESATTTRTLRNLKKSLSNSLETKYSITDKEKINDLLAIHGLVESNFDFVNLLSTFINEHLNDNSIDSNSNKNEKTIEALNQEISASIRKTTGLDYLYRTMRDTYGKKDAKRLMGEMLDLSLGLSDSTNILKPYCWAIDASKLVLIGRDFGQLRSKACKRWSSYTSALCETVHQLSSHLAGAIAIGTFFLDFAHLGIYKMGVPITALNFADTKKEIENEYQQFVHSVNHLSRGGSESPFTNISIFDREKLKALISKGNYDWYFPIDEESGITEDYIIEYIIKLQDIFLDFFDKGDPIQGGSPYRFPIVTLNISKKEHNGYISIQDRKFLNSVVKRDIFRYNIFTSEGTKVASCCRLLSDKEMLDNAASANSFGGGMMNVGSHRVCTINFNRLALEATSIEDYFKRLTDRIDDAAKILAGHKKLLKQLTEKGLQQFIQNGWINISRLFSTFGVIGLYEASITMQKKFGDLGMDIIEKSLTHLNASLPAFREKYDIICNIEQIPGESFAVRLVRADKVLYGEEAVPFMLYANQFIPLWNDATIWEKMDVDGKYNKLVTGGGIVHAQIGEKLTGRQASKIIQYAIKSGCEHFALNSVYTKFKDDSVILGRFDVHPETNSPAIEYYTRVVGFFTPVSSWNEIRRTWEFPKRTFVHIEDDDSCTS